MFINTKNLICHRQIKSIIAPVFGIAAMLIIWHLLSLNPETSLPSPFQVTTDTWGLIIDPFFNKGGNNKGFFWLILASLERVMFGYSLAAIVGISIGFIISLNKFIRD